MFAYDLLLRLLCILYMYACYTAMWQGRIQDFGVEGALAGGPPGWNSPARGQGQSPGEGLGAKPEENHLRRGKKQIHID